MPTKSLVRSIVREFGKANSYLRCGSSTVQKKSWNRNASAMEEATLRAKIQAMKNLLEAKQQSALPKTTNRHFKQANYGRYQAVSGPVNRSWNRFSGLNAPTNPSSVAGGSINKVWRRDSAPSREVSSVSMNKTRKRPVKLAANKRKSIQLRVLRLEDGEYAKAKSGFSLVRAGVKKPTGPNVPQAIVSAKPVPVSNSKSKSVHIGGVKYLVANGGKVLKRCSTEERRESNTYRQRLVGITSSNGAARAALIRAKATVQRARSKQFQTKYVSQIRTEYCSFFHRFGYCKKKDKCRFIHDSRRVRMCRKFLKNGCKDFKCLLSHQHDENKVPDCKMFLRGACTRESCKYRHVKVSATADLCKAFTNGYCPKGGACPLRHELPKKSPIASGQNSSSKMASASGTLSTSYPKALSALSGSAVANGSPRNHNTDLLIRPNIQFTSKHNSGFPSLFDGLRRTAN